MSYAENIKVTGEKIKVRFRIEWGAWHPYIKSHFEPMEPHGEVLVEEGKINETCFVHYSGRWGPLVEKLEFLREPRWSWRPDEEAVRAKGHRLGGVIVVVEGTAKTRVKVNAGGSELYFSLDELLRNKLLVQRIGNRHSIYRLTARIDGYSENWYYQEDLDNLIQKDGLFRKLIEASEFYGGSLEREKWFREECVWIPPGQEVKVKLVLPHLPTDSETEQHFIKMILRATITSPERTQQIPWGHDSLLLNRRLQINVSVNGQRIFDGSPFFKEAKSIPLLEEVVVNIQAGHLRAGENLFQIKNLDFKYFLLLARAVILEDIKKDFSVILSPKWVIAGEIFGIELECLREHKDFSINVPEGIQLLGPFLTRLSQGHHRFRFRGYDALANAGIDFISNTSRTRVIIGRIFTALPERHPFLVGFETSQFTPKEEGFIEGLLKEMKDTRIGDFVDFRGLMIGATKDDVVKWSRICLDLGIYYVMAKEAIDVSYNLLSAVWEAGGGFMLGELFHETDGDLFGHRHGAVVYGWKLPGPGPHTAWEAELQRKEKIGKVTLDVGPIEKCSMKEAHENWIKSYGGTVSHPRKAGVPIVASYSAMSHHYGWESGIDISLSQFNKSHNCLLLSEARGAAKSYGDRVWGSYIAEGAHRNPETDENLRMWWLSLYLSYVCGASIAMDEENLWYGYHDRLHSRSDKITETRRQILREFNEFIKTHPRRGKSVVKQAFLLGLHSCDCTDGLECNVDPEPRVWGSFGEKSPAWWHLTPEYGSRFLKVFFPDAWLQSIQQDCKQLRYWYSGTPLGELDVVPVTAPVQLLSGYNLLFLMGWNTMTDSVYASLKSAVEKGATLLACLPQMTTHESRDFLKEMNDLKLYKDGDLRDLFGISVIGKGGIINKVIVKDCQSVHLKPVYSMNGVEIPHHPPVPAARIELIDAEPIAFSEHDGSPILIRRKVGKGWVYLLTTWDYHGNSNIAPFVADVLRWLSRETNDRVRIEDPSGDVYYSLWRDDKTGIEKIYFLNTDWTADGNQRKIKVIVENESFNVTVCEGRLLRLIKKDELLILTDDPVVFVDSIKKEESGYLCVLHGTGEVYFSVCLIKSKPLKFQCDDADIVKVDEEDNFYRMKLRFIKRSMVEVRIS